MSLIKYLNNEVDFLFAGDFISLLKDDCFSEDDLSKIKEYLKNKDDIMLTSKHPIYDFEGEYLEDTYILKDVRYSSKDDLYLIDKKNKNIILFENSIRIKLRFLSYDLSLSINEDNKFKSNLDGYNLYDYYELRKEYYEFLTSKTNELIKKHYDELYLLGKNIFLEDVDNSNHDKKLNELKNSLLNELKFEYIKSKNIDEPVYEYIHKLDSSIFYKPYSDKERNLELKLLIYLSDKKSLEKMIDDEFEKAISCDKCYPINRTHVLFFINEYKKALKDEYLQSIQTDSKLNRYKQIIEASLKAGKTININGFKYDNILTTNINNLEIGSYGKYISFDEIKVMKYGRNILFDISK